MGSPTIWWYPEADGSLESITLDHVSRLEEELIEDSSTSRSMEGITYVRRFSSAYRRTLVVDVIAPNATVLRQLRALERHLNAGGMIGFALDSSTAWAGYATQLPRRGGRLVQCSPLALYNTAAALVDDSEIVIESASPERKYEHNSVIDFTAPGSVTLTYGLTYNYNERPIIVRQRDFYPAMQRSPDSIGRVLVTTENGRITYRLTVTLDEAADGIRALVQAAQIASTSSGGRLRTLPQVVDEIRWRANRGMRRP